MKLTKRFLGYSIIGVGTFLFDLYLLNIFTNQLGWYYLQAVIVAFLIAVSINYALSRYFVFKGTTRSVAKGYLYFLQIVIFGVLLTTGFVYLLVEYTPLQPIQARVYTAGIVGIFNFLMNNFFNFKVK